MTFYKPVNPNPHFVELEKSVIQKWENEGTFQKSVKGGLDFVFYDGPPFANGLPHYGHLLTGFIKDTIARYQTMFGKKVERRFGWDCHGLPAEMGAEKELGISGKQAIENYGIENFNNHCRTSVMKYSDAWRQYVKRQGRFVDMDNDYKTMDVAYMESVIWAFKELHKKGYVYQSMRVMPYSWACQTPVSDFETRMDNAYREKASKAATVKFTLAEKLQALEQYKDLPTHLVAWTTTPWTLPSNLALAVGAEISYSVILHNNECYIIAESLSHNYLNELGNNVVCKIKGADLINLHYEPLFDYFKSHSNAFIVLPAEFVTTTDGTGIVHIAPGFGEDDYNLCQANNIEVVCPIDAAAKFTYPVSNYEGMHVFEANDQIIIDLKAKAQWIKTEQYLHNYPHCWRTDTPLIYRALPSWYIKVTAFKDRMIANNQQINWIPGHIKNGIFGKWLENARDWSISRNRYWGCPIPVWQSDDPRYPCIEVYGSIQELKDAFGVEIKDLHRPFIDTLTKPNPNDPTGKSKLVRVTDVLDCWFESGSMPYAQAHYPFENKDWFERNFPADFIVEYVAQTRGWFYTLLVLSTALFDKPPFLNCICHGVLLGDDGQKLSKRLANYADPNLVFETIGSDAMRWFMLSQGVMRGQELVIDKDASLIKEAMRKVIKPLYNSYNFFVLYANADNIKAEYDFTSRYLLDRYILSKVFELSTIIKNAIESYDTITACKQVEAFLDSLNNWYIRRSRKRFWQSTKDENKQCAYNTLYAVISVLVKSIAPLLPMICETIFEGLGNDESVHLSDYPIDKYSIDHNLLQQMERVRSACTAALSIRNDAKVRVRQPLKSVTFIGVSEGMDEVLSDLILEEINVKEWNNLPKDKILDFATYKLRINFQNVGKSLPLHVKDIIAAQKAGEWRLSNAQLEIAGQRLDSSQFELLLEAKEEYKGKMAALPSNDALVLLDLNLTSELIEEGIVRDLIRAIQQIRKDMSLDVTDKIKILLWSENKNLISAVENFATHILEQTLAVDIKFTQNDGEKYDIEGIEAIIKCSLAKIA